MKRLTLTVVSALAAIALAGCSELSSLTAASPVSAATPGTAATPSATATPASPVATITGDVQELFPPTVEVLQPSCSAASPTAVQQIACKLYETNVAVCGINVAAVNGVIEGAAVFVPGYGPAIAAAAGVASPVISADQQWWCLEMGYAQKIPATAAAAPAPAASTAK